MRMRDFKDRHHPVTHDWPPTRIYAQVRPSSGLRYPRLELDRWYPVRRQDDLGCFLEIGNAEMYIERGHYICREGRRGSDKSRREVVPSGTGFTTNGSLAMSRPAEGG